MTRRTRGLTLLARMDQVHVQALKKRLRLPRGDAPGWSHDLHRLYKAYLALEDDYLDLVNRNRSAVDVLMDRTAAAIKEREARDGLPDA